MAAWIDRTPEWVAAELSANGLRRAWLVTDSATGALHASTHRLQAVADYLSERCEDFDAHEAIFLEVGARSGALFAAFIHRTRRGQAQGGLRHWPYPDLRALLEDGLRLAKGMGRKCSLAGLWWGGGKGIIARTPGECWRDSEYRQLLYAEYGEFVSSLQGCYVTGEDAGTTPLDMAEVHRHTRFATCVPTEVGGSGNPSAWTAAGVVCAMESALEFTRMGDLSGKRIAMQGAGNVGSFMIEELLDRGVAKIIVAETSPERRSMLRDQLNGRPVEIRAANPGDDSILAADCDILAPNALGAVLNAKTIPDIRARIVCGAANNQLSRGEADAALLVERRIVYVPDYIANRMGIVTCSNEHAGILRDDPAIRRHLDPDWPESIRAVTRCVLERSQSEGTTSTAAADGIADERAEALHPIWGHRARQIIDDLVSRGWAGA